MKTQISDLKIRFFDELSEKWLPFWLASEEIANHDWVKMPEGMKHYMSLSALGKDGNPFCDVFLYKTKTQRVICIKAFKEP